jgi:phosphatidylglycerol:prolipoprotein diacylglycerol transferase
MRKPRTLGLLSGMFLIGYGVFRIIVEFFREPDAHLGFIFSHISMGQILSLPMVLVGIAIIFIGANIQASAAIKGAK